jgi:hypothetical protein
MEASQSEYYLQRFFSFNVLPSKVRIIEFLVNHVVRKKSELSILVLVILQLHTKR